MRQSNEMSEQVGAVMSAYRVKYPTATHFLSFPDVKNLIEYCNMDIGFIEQSIMSLSQTTSKGEVPRWEWVSAAVKNNFGKKYSDKPKPILECTYTPHQQIMLNEWNLPKDLSIEGIEPAIMAEIFEHLLLTEQITQEDHRLGLLGIKVFTGEADLDDKIYFNAKL